MTERGYYLSQVEWTNDLGRQAAEIMQQGPSDTRVFSGEWSAPLPKMIGDLANIGGDLFVGTTFAEIGPVILGVDIELKEIVDDLRHSKWDETKYECRNIRFKPKNGEEEGTVIWIHVHPPQEMNSDLDSEDGPTTKSTNSAIVAGVVNSGDPCKGPDLQIQIKVSGNTLAIADYSFTVLFDPSRLKFKSAKDVGFGGSPITRQQEPGKVLLTSFNHKPSFQNGSLANLNFTVHGDVGDKHSIRFERIPQSNLLSSLPDLPITTEIDNSNTVFHCGKDQIQRSTRPEPIQANKITDDMYLCLNIDEKSSVLERLFLSDDKMGGFIVGLFGAWGSGKTTLALKIANRLTNRGYDTIIFNAWQYRGKPYTWIALHEKFLAKVNQNAFALVCPPEMTPL